MRSDIIYLEVLVNLVAQVCLLHHHLVDLVALEYQVILEYRRDLALPLIQTFHPNLVNLKKKGESRKNRIKLKKAGS